MKVQVLDQKLNPGTRRYRFTLASGETWTGRVLWIDEATATEPLELVLGGEQGSTKALTLHGTYWHLGTSRGTGGTIVQKIEAIVRPRRAKRHGGLDELLVIKEKP